MSVSMLVGTTSLMSPTCFASVFAVRPAMELM
jgi:hypothetical protein